MKRSLAILVVAAVIAVGCGGGSDGGSAVADSPTAAPTATQTEAPMPPPSPTAPATPAATGPVLAQRLVPEVISSTPHDPGAWTQGLIHRNGRMFESTGAHEALGTLREVDPTTGEITRLLTVDAPFYPEGLEQVDDRLIQLTWQDQVAFVYDLETFQQIGTFSYEGEGWGLCLDGDHLVMSDGTDQLQFRDPGGFTEIAPRVNVTLDGQPLADLNELECVDGTVWANVWTTDLIVGIDPNTGEVTALVDASSLPRPAEANVLNGIAHNSETGNFHVTGKWWPTTYEVRFVPAG